VVTEASCTRFSGLFKLRWDSWPERAAWRWCFWTRISDWGAKTLPRAAREENQHHRRQAATGNRRQRNRWWWRTENVVTMKCVG